MNTLKTKVVVFRNGGYLRSYEKWFYGDSLLETVSYYKYLGLNISSRLSWFMTQKTLAEQASKAIFSLKSSLVRFGTLSSVTLMNIFDTKVLPILLYASEIWFSHKAEDIERVHHTFCKHALRITYYAPNCFVRGELGRYTIRSTRMVRAVKYWLRILKLPHDRLPNKCYKIQLKWCPYNQKMLGSRYA